jgi:hypothetical protein
LEAVVSQDLSRFEPLKDRISKAGDLQTPLAHEANHRQLIIDGGMLIKGKGERTSWRVIDTDYPELRYWLSVFLAIYFNVNEDGKNANVVDSMKCCFGWNISSKYENDGDWLFVK